MSRKAIYLIVGFLLISSGFLGLPYIAQRAALRSQAQSGSTNEPGCAEFNYTIYGTVSDTNCLIRDVFSMDATGGSCFNTNQWGVLGFGSRSVTLGGCNPQEGMEIGISAQSGWVGFGLYSLSSYSFSSSNMSVSAELADYTSRYSNDGYYSIVLLSPSQVSGSNPGGLSNWVEVQISDQVSGNHLQLVEKVNGATSVLWQSQYTGYDWFIFGLTVGPNGYLDLEVASYNSQASVSGTWFDEYTTHSSGLTFSSGYLYDYESTDSALVENMSSQFISATYEVPQMDASIGIGLSYMARAYQPIHSANGKPMAVMLDVPGPELYTYDETFQNTNFAGQPGVTNDPFDVGAPEECYTNPCQWLGTRSLAEWSNGEMLMYTFTAPIYLGNLVLSGPPYVSLIVNETSSDPLRTTYSVEEVYYSSLTTVQVWLGSTELFVGNQVGHKYTLDVTVGTFGARYVARHITRVAFNIFGELGYSSQADALANFMSYYGYGIDFYDSMFFNRTGTYPNNYLWQDSTFPDTVAYYGLPVEADSTAHVFPYKSRLALEGAQQLYVNVLLGQLSNSANMRQVPPEEDGLLALYDLWLTPYFSNSGSQNLQTVGQLISAMGWDGNGVRRQVCVSGICAGYPAYPEYDLGVFLTAASFLWATQNNPAGCNCPNSTVTNWVRQAVSVALGTQDLYSIEVAGQTSKIQLADQVGGFFGGYQYSPAYEYINWQSGFVTDLTNFLTESGFGALDPPYSPGYGFTGTESSGLVLQGLIIADAVASPAITGQPGGDNIHIQIDPQPEQPSAYGSIKGSYQYAEENISAKGEFADAAVSSTNGQVQIISGISAPLQPSYSSVQLVSGVYLNGSITGPKSGQGGVNIYLCQSLELNGQVIGNPCFTVGAWDLYSGATVGFHRSYDLNYTYTGLSANSVYTLNSFVEIQASYGASFNFSSPWTDYLTYWYEGPYYYLSMSANVGGATLSPGSGWYANKAALQIDATPPPCAVGQHPLIFVDWIGTGPGSYSGTNNPANIVIQGSISEEAYFTVDKNIICS
jgi:hypothetical protein